MGKRERAITMPASWLRVRSPPWYRTTRGFTSLPLALGEVSMWAMSPRQGSFSRPGVAGRWA